MATVIFYEKQGCTNNTRQKKLLQLAGHTVIAKNLLYENWADKPKELREFFNDLPVSAWFNRSAPRIKQGLIDPDNLTAEQALALMVNEPLLIRRPLMQVGNSKIVGFNEDEVDQWIGLHGQRADIDLEKCQKSSSSDPDYV